MEGLLKIGEFSALSGISRKLLIFYDRQGILCPQQVDPKNGYRYYSYCQLDSACIIVCLRGAGVPLERIKKYLTEQSSQNLIDILQEQEGRLTEQIQKLEQLRGMVQTYLKQLNRMDSGS